MQANERHPPATPSRTRGNSSGTDVWSPGTPRTPEEVARIRYKTNSYFRYWRAGCKEDWEPPQTRLPWRALPPRRLGAWSGRYSTARASVGARRRRNRTSMRWYESDPDDAPLGGVEEPTKKVMTRLSGVSLKKYLGVGGEGVACLVEVANRQGGSSKAVIKVSLGDDDWNPVDLTAEKKWQLSLKRAKHVVQSIKFADLKGAPNDASDALVDASPKLYFMELMKRGDLHTVIGRAGNTREKLPMIRGCIAMRYPPRLRRITAPNLEEWLPENGPDLQEEVPADPGISIARNYDLVHFDLDPKNIFIGDNQDRVHGTVPIFKVADLGLALRTMDDSFTTPTIWTLRQRGKDDFYLPEQYHKEWEWGGSTPRQQEPRLRVAANFGSWSNVYHIALCMHTLITLHTFPYPPDAVGPFNHQTQPARYAVIGTIRNYWGDEVPPFHTNGAELATEQELDTRLRDLLMRCLAIEPKHRPLLVELEAWALDAESNPSFYADIGGDLMSAELADRFTGRPSDPPDVTPGSADPTARLAQDLANLEVKSRSLPQ